MPHSIKKLKENNYLVIDMYKKSLPQVPTNAGIILLFSSYLSIAIYQLLARLIGFHFGIENFDFNLSQEQLALLLVVSVYSIYGLVDDLLDIDRVSKLLLPIFFGYPLVSVISPNYIPIPFIGEFDLMKTVFLEVTYNDIFRITIIPIYVMVVSNLVNMYSGYNGLQSGLSIIILITLVVESIQDSKTEILLVILPFLGALCVFWIFNKYPAAVFEGNIGSLMVGSLIGCFIVIQNYWWFGFFILIPHTINFILWIIWVIGARLYPDQYLLKGGKHEKFGSVDDEGNIVVPNRLTLKWIPNYYFRINEQRTTLILYAISLSFCISGIILF